MVRREDLFRTVCLFVCGIWPKLMNGFPRIELEGLAITKRFANKLFARQPACKENLRNFFTGCHFQTMQEEIWSIKKKKRLEKESEFRFRHSWRRFALFFLDFFFFIVGGGFTHSSDQKLFQLIKACTLNPIGWIVDSSGRGNNWRRPRVGGERQTASGGNKW